MTTFPIYQIRISGLLDPSWSDWFDGLAITYLTDEVTILTGPLPDQAALHGVLNKIRDLGLILLSVSADPAVSNDQHKS
jgi:hypothetical protein